MVGHRRLIAQRPAMASRPAFSDTQRESTYQASALLARALHCTKHTMEPSPLTQDSRPDIFQPKIIQLYKTLLKVRAPIHAPPSQLT